MTQAEALRHVERIKYELITYTDVDLGDTSGTGERIRKSLQALTTYIKQPHLGEIK